ncbi:hypothetical protein CANCADRAFT_31643 [Tortispora caseinolytica NRRL Y-17796]|uniref:Cytosolic Fe-S cluster assembly factor NAR1 n=1 Tax=Tortispora caseinolytica NRRL Y-17796 TaxID=767744 RepID=A0A1E4TGA7_9ASCO|nr:hypothetical protein CANCADRAFT_31643 [Tortispora caseinolytica NRRL Y-17796]
MGQANEFLTRIPRDTTDLQNVKPVICSMCPGWVCYVEKTHPHIIPYMSKIRSPQQIAGVILKDIIAKEVGCKKNEIYHVSIMPCFDKKLEAAREEFSDNETGSKDVDCVITTREIVQLLENENMDFAALELSSEEAYYTYAPANWIDDAKEAWKSHDGSSSGGALYYNVKNFLNVLHKEYPQRNIDVQVIPGKNNDSIEYVVADQDSGEVFGRAAQLYGFRNIQNLVRKLKGTNRRRRDNVLPQWNYVEVMACPGGCVNGGGQIGAPDGVNDKEWLDRLNAIYSQIDKTTINEENIRGWVNKLGISAESFLDCEFTEVKPDPSMNAALAYGSKW